MPLENVVPLDIETFWDFTVMMVIELPLVGLCIFEFFIGDFFIEIILTCWIL